MTVQFLVGLVALASLTWLCAWLGFHSEILQIEKSRVAQSHGTINST
jgi:hypothetical protein